MYDKEDNKLVINNTTHQISFTPRHGLKIKSRHSS